MAPQQQGGGQDLPKPEEFAAQLIEAGGPEYAARIAEVITAMLEQEEGGGQQQQAAPQQAGGGPVAAAAEAATAAPAARGGQWKLG